MKTKTTSLIADLKFSEYMDRVVEDRGKCDFGLQAVAGFLDNNHCFRSVTTQISDYAGWTLNPYTG